MTLIQTGPFAGLLQNGYGTIYADPAWTYVTRSDKGKDRSPERHYDCMTLEEIKALPVRDLAAKNCVLFLWVIDTHLRQAFEVMDAWGFAYKTRGFMWAKTQKVGGVTVVADSDPMPEDFFMGSGHWTRANPEDCLLATKGAPKRQDAGVRRLLISPRREHSRKPDEAIERIERLVPGPYVELFSRTDRPGWDSWGNEAGKFSRITPTEQRKIDALI